jgi:hypothetical protein
MEDATLQNLIGVLEKASEGLNIEVSTREIEDLAVDVHRSLSLETRRFHTLEHVFSLVDLSAPIRSLAAVFHDLVYYQVDQGFPKPIYPFIKSYIIETNEALIVKTPSGVDRPYKLLLDLFEIAPGQILFNAVGINEFLSALVAWKKLEHDFSEIMLLKIAVHIEATIPFRGKNEHNVGHFDVMAGRLKSISLNYGIPLSDAKVDETILSAMMFANQDVAGFAQSDPAKFLDNTWKLLPEGNAELRLGRIYTICDYRQALQKMESFFAWLEPGNIFHSYHGVPAERDLLKITTTASRNIDIAREYLGVKLLAIAILEALAETTGGDAPLALFMGDIHLSGITQLRLENFLPTIDKPTSLKIDEAIYHLLADGRSGQSQFDLQNSPLAFYLYKCLGSDGCEKLLSVAQEMFAGKLSPMCFLKTIDPPVVLSIVQACEQMVPTRRDLLNHFASTALSQ